MLLQRITQHLKEQNWFAAGLDLVIVILGIFLGLQAQQWYLDREFEESEQILLNKLIDEIETNNRLAQYKIAYRSQVSESGERAIKFLNGNEPCSDKCWSLLVDFFMASQATTGPIVSNVLEEMKRLGLPRDENVRSKVDAYYVLGQGFSNATSINFHYPYRDSVRQLMSSKAHKILWETCLSVEVIGLERLNPDCPQGLPDDEINIMLKRFRAEPRLKEYLNHWVGMQYPWQLFYRTQITAGLEAVAAIEQSLMRPNGGPQQLTESD